MIKTFRILLIIAFVGSTYSRDVIAEEKASSSGQHGSIDRKEDRAVKRTFEANAGFSIPDGTIIYPFLNSRDAQQSGVPWSLLSGFSIARGILAPGTALTPLPSSRE